LLSPTVFPCRIDPAQFQSAVLNLVTNACAAMPSGGRVTIETQNVEIDAKGEPGADLEAGSYVLVVVADTGTGMAAEVAARAFEPFFTTKEAGVGTGLGLSQVYGFARQSGGGVTLLSEPGVGTAVRLYLPRSLEGDRAAQASGALLQPSEPAAPATIMVVDDDPEVRAVLVQSVETLGYRVTQAIHGSEALERIMSGEPVDLVLTDYLMPGGLTGRELTERIAALGRDIRLVLISGNLAPEEAGAVPVLHKPFRLGDLERALAEALAR
jgi:CheY-like chemotaxis protein